MTGGYLLIQMASSLASSRFYAVRPIAFWLAVVLACISCYRHRCHSDRPGHLHSLLGQAAAAGSMAVPKTGRAIFSQPSGLFRKTRRVPPRVMTGPEVSMMDKRKYTYREEDTSAPENDIEEEFVLVRVDGTWLAEAEPVRQGFEVVPATLASEIADATDSASRRG